MHTQTARLQRLAARHAGNRHGNADTNCAPDIAGAQCFHMWLFGLLFHADGFHDTAERLR